MGVHVGHRTYQTIKELLGIDTHEDWRQDEPIFILRAQDQNASRVLEFYEDLCEIDGCDPTFLENLRQVKDAFNHFSIEHRDQMKRPD